MWAKLIWPLNVFDRSVEGKGMSLYIVKMQVERLGGSITVQSQSNAGAEFKVEPRITKK
ncbi:ATP-binding protein [Mucilaginibacter terrae]|uniref:Sensor histidine kinase regulating citrate/malate metabolism n=1 Tax=Mucilaginibacter terrae TaxID=1955052 RepID=A0ABU3GQS5_9SPHI|nr:ATP-binding protein [Mucilaginibacter terrae]MDT3402117.1 sensor histidine kinase regulating citrate/malate metabolism [Mucilaginibacter terrae]